VLPPLLLLPGRFGFFDEEEPKVGRLNVGCGAYVPL